MKEHYIFEYLWIDTASKIRSKTYIFHYDFDTPLEPSLDTSFQSLVPCSIERFHVDAPSLHFLPLPSRSWNGEVILHPRYVCKNPFKHERWYYVLCETGDNRTNVMELYRKYQEERIQVGFRQEFYILDKHKQRPLGFDENDYFIQKYKHSYRGINHPDQFEIDYPKQYCRTTSNYASWKGSEMMEEYVELCLNAGIYLVENHGGMGIGQWSYTIGMMEGVEACDQLWISRYLLEKMGNKYNLIIHWENEMNLNFFWDGQRQEKQLHTTLRYLQFPKSVCSVLFSNERKGYVEDQQPSANCDPYLVIFRILSSLYQSS